MTCPLYVDYTRDCVTKFEKLLPVVTFDFCNSDDYKTCPFYKVIIEKKTYCKNLERCSLIFIKNAPFLFKNTETYNKIANLVDDYCLNTNCENCAIYKKIEEGKKVPKLLLADGSKLKIRDIIL